MAAFRKLCLYTLVGILAGISSSVLMVSLEEVTRIRLFYPYLTGLLPLAGLVSAGIYEKFGKKIIAGHVLVFEEIHDPKQILPLRFAPLVFINTLLTHLFGGSAGREGTAVQMGASLADQFSKIFHVARQDRPTLLRTGLAASFGAALGAPWAGAIFGMEVKRRGQLHYQKVGECLLASWVGYYVAHIILSWFRPQTEYSQIETIQYTIKTISSVLVLGIVAGLWARGFSKLVHHFEYFLKRKIPFRWQMCAGGLMLVVFYEFFGSEYAGLSIPLLQNSLQQAVSIKVPLLKTGATILTVGSGFKGGEFVPLVVIGTGLGSLLGQVCQISIPFLASLGFGAVFAGAANVPLTCAVLLMELFGFKMAFYALLVCYVSYFVSGKDSVY